MGTKLSGLYRGTVWQNVDPQGRHRIQVQVPGATLSGTFPWAEACVAAPTVTVPERGSAVWVLFEQGDPSRPVWMGAVVG